MKSRTVSVQEITEAEHQIAGLGEILIRYTTTPMTQDYSITITKMRSTLRYTGKEAKTYASQMLLGERNSDYDLHRIKYIAAEACETTVEKMASRSRSSEAVYARNLVMFVAVREYNRSLSAAGALFDRDHATAHRAIRIVDSETRFKSPQTRFWESRFFKAIDDYKATKNDKTKNSQSN